MISAVVTAGHDPSFHRPSALVVICRLWPWPPCCCRAVAVEVWLGFPPAWCLLNDPSAQAAPRDAGAVANSVWPIRPPAWCLRSELSARRRGRHQQHRPGTRDL